MQHAHNGEKVRRVREGGQKAQRDKSPHAVLYQHGEVRPSCVRGRETGPRDPSNWGEYVMGVIGHGPGPNAQRSVESTYIRLEKYRNRQFIILCDNKGKLFFYDKYHKDIIKSIETIVDQDLISFKVYKFNIFLVSRAKLYLYEFIPESLEVKFKFVHSNCGIGSYHIDFNWNLIYFITC